MGFFALAAVAGDTKQVFSECYRVDKPLCHFAMCTLGRFELSDVDWKFPIGLKERRKRFCVSVFPNQLSQKESKPPPKEDWC